MHYNHETCLKVSRFWKSNQKLWLRGEKINGVVLSASKSAFWRLHIKFSQGRLNHMQINSRFVSWFRWKPSNPVWAKNSKKRGRWKVFLSFIFFWPESVIFKVAPWQGGSFGWSPFKPHISRYRSIAEFILTSCHQTKPVWICPHQHFYELIWL